MKMSAATWIAASLAPFLALAGWAGSAETAAAAGCRDMTYGGAPYTVCEADPATDSVRLFLNGTDGTPLGTFRRVEEAAADEGRTVVFAMNGGMYHPDRSPVGLYVEKGVEIAPLVTREGPGNFAMLPNGVLCLKDGTATITESHAFAEQRPGCDYATQSGPMLVIDGKLHPRFLEGSDSRHIRNGVGVTPDGTLLAVISDAAVNFWDFATFFRDGLGATNALYMDGKVSRLYAPGIGRYDAGFPLGPILAVTKPAD